MTKVIRVPTAMKHAVPFIDFSCLQHLLMAITQLLTYTAIISNVDIQYTARILLFIMILLIIVYSSLYGLGGMALCLVLMFAKLHVGCHWLECSRLQSFLPFLKFFVVYMTFKYCVKRKNCL